MSRIESGLRSAERFAGGWGGAGGWPGIVAGMGHDPVDALWKSAPPAGGAGASVLAAYIGYVMSWSFRRGLRGVLG
jgi:hypothetical protein